MLKGQKIVCINDTFTDFIRAIYTQFPVKGETYTIHEVFLGRERFCMVVIRPPADYGSRNSTIHLIHFMAGSRNLVSLQNVSPS
jgi:hypothetical protein